MTESGKMAMTINRRAFLKLSAAVAGASALGVATGCSADSAANTNQPAALSTDRLASFVLLSDTHVNEDDELSAERFTEVLRQIADFEVQPDSIFIVGDITNAGRQAQWDLLWKLIDESPFARANFTFACGNHDQLVIEDTEEEYAQYRQRFVDNTGVPSLYYQKEIAGQHFIMLGPDEPLPNNWSQFEITDTQLEWLDGKLTANDKKGVVSYVMCHEPIDNTVTGTLEGQWGKGNSFRDHGEGLLAVMKKHPHSVLVTGHSHIFPGVTADDPSLPIFVNTGSAYRSYYSLESARRGELVFDGAQMHVFSDHLEFNIRNFSTNAWEGDTIVVSLDRQ